MSSDLLLLIQAFPLAFAALMPVINPIGTAIIIRGFTEAVDSETRRALSRAIAFNTVILLAVLLLGGRYLLSFFGISVPIVQLAGGFVLAAMGYGWLNETDGPTVQEADAVSVRASPWRSRLTRAPGCHDRSPRAPLRTWLPQPCA